MPPVCCPGYAGRRGAPYTAHWLLVHDGDGAIDLDACAELDGLPRSDVEMAVAIDRMTREAGAPMLHGAQSGSWMLWDGSGVYARQHEGFASRMTRWAAAMHWEACRDVAWVQQQAIELLPVAQQRAAADTAKRRWGKVLALRDRMWSDAGQGALERQLAAVCAVDERELDAGVGEIVVDNGRISYAQILRDGFVRLLPHDSSKRDTRRTGAGVRYDPDARAPWFRRFLETSVADRGQRDWLLWRTCNTLFGRMPVKGFVNPIGERDSGKSTYTELIAALGGGYAHTVPVETFLAKHAGDAGFKQAELRGARFVYTHEPSAGGRFDESLMKTLTGRDRQTTAGKYEKPVTWTPQLTVFIGSNKPVRFNSGDDAFMRRHEVVSFARGYTEPDDRLAERLRGELSGILNELLSYAVREAQWGTPGVPQSMVDARERLADETESALEFIAQWQEEGRLVVKPDASAYASIGVARLYTWYAGWCTEAGERPVSRAVFRSVVERRHTVVKSAGVRHFQGLLAR